MDPDALFEAAAQQIRKWRDAHAPNVVSNIGLDEIDGIPSQRYFALDAGRSGSVGRDMKGNGSPRGIS